MIPLNKKEFKRLKCRGIVSEMAVQETAIWNLDLYSHLRGHQDCEKVLMTRDIKPSDPFDILGYAVTSNHLQAFTVEVKSAKNGGRYDSFFAELVQLGSMSYSEYLVYPPTYMVYVDTESQVHFWYDGKTFAAAVKSQWANRIYNTRGTAAGIRFKIADPAYGYLWSFNQSRTDREIYDSRQDEIQQMMQVEKDMPSLKVCADLPDLTDQNMI